jgi:hypothetical protein
MPVLMDGLLLWTFRVITRRVVITSDRAEGRGQLVVVGRGEFVDAVHAGGQVASADGILR